VYACASMCLHVCAYVCVRVHLALPEVLDDDLFAIDLPGLFDYMLPDADRELHRAW
jgi:hypothetical protein